LKERHPDERTAVETEVVVVPREPDPQRVGVLHDVLIALVNDVGIVADAPALRV
jgi:hypothetical protein